MRRLRYAAMLRRHNPSAQTMLSNPEKEPDADSRFFRCGVVLADVKWLRAEDPEFRLMVVSRFC